MLSRICWNWLLIFGVVEITGGCAESMIFKTRREIAEMKQSIPQRQAELAEVQQNTASIKERATELGEQINVRETELDDLNQKLQSLDREIAAERKTSVAAREKLGKARETLKRYQAKIASLKNNPTVSSNGDEEKLKEEVRAYLKMGLERQLEQ